jgi:hypothetical protein
MEIRIEMHNSLNTRKFKAMERYIDEDEAELQRRVLSYTHDDLRPTLW